MEPVRINKFLSEVGFCSRRAADTLLEEGRILINDKIPEHGTKVCQGDQVKVDGVIISKPVEEAIYIAFNKPVGIVCTTDTATEKDNIIDYINHPKRIFPIGRLDKPSEGLIFLTSDGDIVNKILRARNFHEKEYIVAVDKAITDDFIQKMANGVLIRGEMTQKCVVVKLDTHKFKIILTQGLNRQIRKMCSHFDYSVSSLKRVRIMNIKLDVPTGKWRYFTEKEMTEINKLLADSSKVQD